MLARVRSAAVLGIDAYLVEVETDIANGLPTFVTVGLPQGAVKEGRDRVSPAVPGRLRWHRDRRVAGEHRDDGVDVGALPGIDEAVDELAQPLVSKCLHGGLLASCGQSLVDGLVRAL